MNNEILHKDNRLHPTDSISNPYADHPIEETFKMNQYQWEQRK